MYTLESESRSIVLVGSFNPAIFHPMWFVHNDLMDEADAENAHGPIVTSNSELTQNALLSSGAVVTSGPIVTPDIAIFSIDTDGFQFRLEVQKGRFAVTSMKPASWLEMRDLVTQTFEILEHTPIQQLGINREARYSISTEDRWKEIVDILSPKAPWNRLHAPETLEVMVKGNRDKTEAKYIRTDVLPSKLSAKYSLVIKTNEHYAWETAVSGNDASETITKNWDDAYEFSKELAESIISVEVTL